MEGTGLSRSAVNLACNALYQAGLLTCERRGRMNFYAVADRHPFVRQFKVLDTIARLEPLLAKLQPLSRRIVLFGSCAQGTDTADSDVDLFIYLLSKHYKGGPTSLAEEVAVLGRNRLVLEAQISWKSLTWRRGNLSCEMLLRW